MNTSHNTTISISNGTLVRVLLFGFLVVALIMLRDILLVLLTAIVMASFVVKASNSLLRRYKINRTFSVVTIYLISLAILSTIVYFFVPILISELSNLLSLIPDIKGFGTDALSGLKDLTNNLSHSNSVSDVFSGTQGILRRASESLFGTLSFVFGGLANFVLIIVLSFYFSIQEKSIENFLRIVVPFKHEEYAISLWERSQRKIALWVRGQLLLGIVVGVLVYIGLSILGLQYALLIAVTAALFELIPFGITLAAIPAISFAFAEDGLTLAIMVAGLYFLIQQLESYVIAPLVVNKMIGISPLVVILSILVGSVLAGFWGIILAIPVAVVLLEFADDIEKDKIAKASV